jgi:phospholipase/carboxylesterase
LSIINTAMMSVSFRWPAMLLLAVACRSSAQLSAARSGGLERQVVGMSEGQKGGRAVVLLHGWGAPGDDLVPLARELAQPETRFIVPAAPLAHPQGGRAWWHLDLAGLQRAAAEGRRVADAVPDGLPEARAKVLALLAEVRQRYQPRSLVLAGFSQGGMLAMDVGLAAQPPVDGIAVLSGTIVAEPVWRERMARKDKSPVLVSHGRSDGLLPFAESERLKALLEGQGYAVTWVPFDGGHTIPPPVVAALGALIRR